MSQPTRAEQQPDSDPLLAFCQEQETPAEPPQTAKDPEPADDLRGRLDRAERQIEQALLDIAKLKFDLATLVTAVDDIRKRPSRTAHAPAPAVAPVRGKPVRLRTAASLVLLLAAGALLWGLVSFAAGDSPAPPPIVDSDSPRVEAPVAVPATTQAAPALATAAGDSKPAIAPGSGAGADDRPAGAAGSATARVSAATGSARARPDRPARDAAYVGTLTVDAEPAGEVFLNRTRVGRTPLRLENLRAGSHLIWIERDGYRRFTRVVPVAADRVSRVSASLDPVSR